MPSSSLTSFTLSSPSSSPIAMMDGGMNMEPPQGLKYFAARRTQQSRLDSQRMAYCSVTSAPKQFGNCLAGFQIHELLALQKSMERMTNAYNDDDADADADYNGDNDVKINVNETCDEPQRMALMAAEPRGHRRRHHHDDEDEARGGGHHGGSGYGSGHGHGDSGPPPWVSSWAPAEMKPSKLQTLFQISITALAFLSFGGYLLCLIVQAIKSKGTTYFHPVATTATATVLNSGSVKRIKVYRRSRRNVNNTNISSSSSSNNDNNYYNNNYNYSF